MNRTDLDELTTHLMVMILCACGLILEYAVELPFRVMMALSPRNRWPQVRR